MTYVLENYKSLGWLAVKALIILFAISGGSSPFIYQNF
jgi:hypothetical protein